MIRYLIFLMYVFIVTPAWAASVTVISGEHEDFSRLVMEFSDPSEWRAGKTDGGYLFASGVRDITYNLDQVFKFIPKNRILNIQDIGDGKLFISTQPNFFLDVFELRGNRVVLDIKDGPAPPNSRFEIPLQAIEGPEFSPEPSVEISTSATSKPEAKKSTDRKAAEMLKSMDFSGPPATTSQQYWPLEDLTQNNNRVLEMEKSLFTQISRAVSQDLLDANLTESDEVLEAVSKLTHIPTVPDNPSSAEHDIQPVTRDETHVRIQTAVDRDKTDATLETSLSHSEVCINSNLLAVEDWGIPLAEGLQIADLRSKALGEFDQPLPNGVEALAKYYLFLTFGEEAKATLNAYNVSIQNSEALKEIADVMSHDIQVPTNILKTQIGCPGASGFWAVLAQNDFSSRGDYQISDIVSYFSSLPPHIRKHLGPKLSEKLLDAGEAQAAELIQNSIARTKGAHGDAVDLLRARMMIAAGSADEAIQILEMIASQDGPFSADALIQVIDVQKKMGQNIDYHLAEAAEVLAVEYRNTPLEGQLITASIDARIHSSRADLAIKTLLDQTNRNSISPLQFKRLLNESAVKIANSFEDLQFTKEAISILSPANISLLSDSTKLLLSERLLDLGFSDLALEFAQFKNQLDDNSKVLLAGIAQGKGELESALGYLLNIDGSTANLMRAEIYLSMNEPALAADAFVQSAKKNASNTALFLAEDWAGLSAKNDGYLSEFASLIMADNEELGSEERRLSLFGAEKILDHSRHARVILNGLLE